MNTNTQKDNRRASCSGGTKSIKAGSYTVAVTVVLLAVLIVVNLIVNAIPSKYTKLDFSTSKMYTISETTEKYLSGLDEDITLWVLCPGGQENAQQMTFLSRYAELSSHLTLKTADPIADPDFISKYTSSSPSEYSVIVEGERRSKVVDYTDMYYYYSDDYGKISLSDYSYYCYYGITADPYFDGDNQLSSAVEYVTAETLPTLYTLSGHGEQEMSDTLAYYVDLSGFSTAELNIALDDAAIPDDCSCIFIYSPTLDLTDSELAKLKSYISDGGHIFMISGSTSAELPAFSELAAECGIGATMGTVYEGSAGSYYPSMPYYFYPTVNSDHSAVTLVSSSGYSVLSGSSHAVSSLETIPDGFTVTDLLTTSSKGYLKSADGSQSDKATISIASAAENETSGARMIWLAAPQLPSDTFINATNGGNLYCMLNMLTWMCDSFISSLPEISAVDISSPTLTVSESSAAVWGSILIFLIPLAVTAVGLWRWNRRRKK